LPSFSFISHLPHTCGLKEPSPSKGIQSFTSFIPSCELTTAHDKRDKKAKKGNAPLMLKILTQQGKTSLLSLAKEKKGSYNAIHL